MQTILVISPENNRITDYFSSTFSKDRIDLRIVSDIEEAKKLLNAGLYNYIFVGDYDDIEWIRQTVYADHNMMVISFTAFPELIQKHKEQVPYCLSVPFYKLPQFIEVEGIFAEM